MHGKVSNRAAPKHSNKRSFLPVVCNYDLGNFSACMSEAVYETKGEDGFKNLETVYIPIIYQFVHKNTKLILKPFISFLSLHTHKNRWWCST